jgi:hypothetical protein
MTTHASTAAIREAFAASEFARAGELAQVYAQELKQAFEQGRAGETELAEVRELIHWTRLVVLGFRAHAEQRLRSACVAGIYSSQG